MKAKNIYNGLELARHINLQRINKMKEILVKFLEWMNEVNASTPMRLETDFEDIAEMFMEENNIE